MRSLDGFRKWTGSFIAVCLVGTSGVPASAGEPRIETPRLVSPVLALEQPATGFAGSRQQKPEAGTGRLVAGGAIGAGLAYGGAILLGSKVVEDCGSIGDECALIGGAYSVAVGLSAGSAGIPLGVHLANGRRGNYGLSLLASTAVAAAGVTAAVLASNGENDGTVLAIGAAIPVAQVLSSILVERATAGRRHPR